MARIKILIEDDNGEKLHEKELTYHLDLKDTSFNALEGAVEKYKQRSSEELMQVLLEQSQTAFLSEKKTTKGTKRTVKPK